MRITTKVRLDKSHQVHIDGRPTRLRILYDEFSREWDLVLFDAVDISQGGEPTYILASKARSRVLDRIKALAEFFAELS